MAKNIGLIIFSAFVGFFATITIYFYATKQHTQVISPLPQTQFSLQHAPVNSLTGIVATFSGSVWWQSRTSDKPVAISTGQILQQGEEIDTENGTAVIEFAKVTRITLLKNTQIGFIQTLPVNVVLLQKTGSAVYEKTSTVPISIRGMDLLINIESGQTVVNVDKDNVRIIIVVTSGSVTLAFTDSSNTSVTKTFSSGKRIVFDNTTKTLSD